MANGLYDAAKQKFLTKVRDWDSDDIRVVLVDTATYTVNLATDNFLDDIPAGERVAVSGAMTTSSAAGVADATDVTLSTVTGDTSEALVIYQHTGVDSTASLMVYIDTASAGLPITPNGADITITWDNGANKIFKL